MNLEGKNVLVTGGASFIGSHLVERLLGKNAIVTIIDDMSSGGMRNINHIKEDVVLHVGDLRQRETVQAVVAGKDLIFHLAADHGGRGYVDLHQVACATNLYLDGILFEEAHKANVEKVVFASSGCVYPNFLQSNVDEEVYLTEEKVGPPYDADHMYGWAKLMAEMTLRNYYLETGMKTASLRYFTVYGPRGKEDHAIIAMIARAFIKQDPFEIWGDGSQVRNWTFVDDIVEGTILAAERINDGSAINLGTMERNTVLDAAKYACELAGYDPEFKFLTEMPTGPLNRVADNKIAEVLLDWTPGVSLVDGMDQTWEWYCSTHDERMVEAELADKLFER